MAAAPRFDDNTTPWRITVLGDPLWTLAQGSPPNAEAQDVLDAFDHATPLDDAIAAAAQQQDLAALARLFIIAGEDGKAIRLARGVLNDQDTRLDAQLARQALFAAERESDAELLGPLFATLPADISDQPVHVSLLWRVWWSKLERSEVPNDIVLRLSERLPPEAIVPAAELLSPHLGRVLGDDARRSFIQRLIEAERHNPSKRRLRRLLNNS